MVMMKASDYAKLESSKAAEKAALAYQQSQKSPTPMPAQTPTSSSNTSYNNSNYSIGSPYSSPSYSPSTPMPATSYTATAPNYSKPSTPSYSVPKPASSYNGSANVIGSVSNSNDIYKSYQGIYDSVRSSDPIRNQINTWADNKGNVYDTTSMTPQQIFALSLAKDNNPNAAAILKGMGLDMNGNPLSSSPSRSTSYQSSVPMPAQSSSTSSSSFSQPSSTGSSVPMPSMAYTKNPEIDKLSREQQLAYYAANPNEARNEIARAKDVYNGTTDPLKQHEANQWANALRQAAGIGMDDATYGNAANSSSTGVYMPQISQQSSSNTQPTGNLSMPASFGQMSPEQIKAEAQARIQQQINDRLRTASQAKSGMQTTFDRSRQTIAQDRALENVQNQRNLSPFSGKSDYAKGIIELERARTDREQSQDLQTRLAAIDMQLSDFLNQTPEMQQNIINELTRQERSYGLELASQNRADKQLNWSMDPNNPNNAGQVIQNQINQLKLGNLPNEIKQAAALFEQQYKSGEISNETAAWKLKELQDPNSPTNHAAKLDLEIKQMEAQYLPQEQKLRLQQLQKQISQIGAAPYRSAEDQAYDKVKLQIAQEELKQMQGGKGSGNAETYSKYIDGAVRYGTNMVGDKYISNGQDIEAMILQSGLPESEMRKLYSRYSLQWGD